jgi:hypothetical protein
MNDTNITRLVVGGPMTVTLGIPVGQRIVQSSAGSIRWSSGAWVGIKKNAARMTLSALGHRVVTRLAFSPKRIVGLVAGIAIFSGASVGGAHLLNQGGGRAPLPFEPATSQGSSVTILQESYTPAAQPQPPDVPIAAGMSIAPAEVIAGGAPALPLSDARAPGPAPRPAAPAIAKAIPAPPASDKLKPAAVILDEGQALPQSARLPQPASSGAKTLQASTGGVQKPGATVDAAAPARSSSRGAGLVAVTPDGKFALFSNPTTRMPEQFKVGDRLPKGDTIRSIDVKSGKVVTTAKEYELE